MQSRIKRALIHLQHILGNLPDALRDRPAVHRFERNRLQDQEIHRSWHQVSQFARGYALFPSVNDRSLCRALRRVKEIVNRPTNLICSRLAMLSFARSQFDLWREFAKRHFALATILKSHNF